MINVKNVVQQMKEEDYNLFLQQLKDNNAEKFSLLLSSLREDGTEEKDIAGKLGTSPSAYYTLKSRLHSRIQDFLSARMSGSKTDMLKKVATIPDLLYNSPKNTAIAVITGLEKELSGYDMPYELTNVYNALKKLHVSSPRYYQYEQLYNRHVAYTIALDKAQDTLAGFNKMLANYQASRDKTMLEVLWMMKKEMHNLCRLYESHHLTVYRNLLDISFALFVPLPEATKEDEPVDDLLAATEKILASYPHDTVYGYLKRVVHFLWFEYYHQARNHKKAGQYFDMVNPHTTSLISYNFCCNGSRFLLSRMERYLILGQAEAMYEENTACFKDFIPDTDAVPEFINYTVHLAAGAFYAGKYQEAVSILNEFLNAVSLKSYGHSEIELKLFLTLAYSMQDKYEAGHNVLKSVTRKLREMDNRDLYENAQVFAKMLAMQMDSVTKGREEKMLLLRDRFLQMNNGQTRLLGFIPMDDNFIRKLAKSVKQA